jgi:hypothetical protein
MFATDKMMSLSCRLRSERSSSRRRFAGILDTLGSTVKVYRRDNPNPLFSSKPKRWRSRSTNQDGTQRHNTQQ